MLFKSKVTDPNDKKSGVIYWYQCGELTCDEEYTGRHPGPLKKIERACEGTLTHPCAQHLDRSQHHP